MKKVLFILLSIVVAAFVYSAIATSAHDFSGVAWNTGDQICQPCHTPHGADTTVANAPLWNHEVTAVVAYTLYDSTTMDATTGQPSASSKLCLSCHDGTVALENWGGVTTGTTTVAYSMGINLSTEHPISFDYDTALSTADGELFDPATDTTDLGGTIDNDLLFGGQVQCASCHDVHNAENLPSLLKIDNSGSNLCLTCHDK